MGNVLYYIPVLDDRHINDFFTFASGAVRNDCGHFAYRVQISLSWVRGFYDF